MRAFDDPVDLIVYMLEKARAISLLKTLEDLSDVVFGDHWFLLNIRHEPVRWKYRIYRTEESISRQPIEKKIKGGNAAVPGNDEISGLCPSPEHRTWS